MKPKTLILMVVAISCGLGASYMTSRLLADRQQEVEKVPVLVAKKPLSTGDTLKVPEDLFEEKQFPKGEEPKLAVVDTTVLKGRILKRSLRTGDFITLDDLLDDKNPGIAYELPAGHQAAGIRVSPESIAGGFASLPHSRVNIISTVRRGDDAKSYSRILLENVLVLAADGTTKINENGQAMPANVVTVAVKPEDVLKLELAKTMGTISLVLRKYADNSKSEINKYTIEGLNSSTTGAEDAEVGVGSSVPTQVAPVVPREPGSKVAGPTALPMPPSGRNVGTVLIYNGAQVTQSQYEKEGAPKDGAPAPEPAPKKSSD